MRKRGVFLFVLFVGSLFFMTNVLGITGEIVTGEVVTGKVTDEPINLSITINQVSAPVLGAIPINLYVCETESMQYNVNATDDDGDDMVFSMTPTDPLFIEVPFTSQSETGGVTTAISKIFSGILSKSEVGVYHEAISVTDGNFTDTEYTNVTVIEVNNPPVMTPPGVQTVNLNDSDPTFYKQLDVSDVENGDENSGNFTFNRTFTSGDIIFNVSSNGTMTFEPDVSLIGNYSIDVCVIDLGMDNTPHANISLCAPLGSTNSSDCESFNLTVTAVNRAPNITSFTPTSLSFTVFGTSTSEFSLTEEDPDGTLPDAYWYVDSVFKEFDSGSLTDEFRYSFGCGVSGNHTVKGEITDGLLNDSIQWNITVNLVTCVDGGDDGGGGGGGSGGPSGCQVEWACYDWETCGNAVDVLGDGDISEETYVFIEDQCVEQDYGIDICGYQERNCFDVNNCDSDFGQPDLLQACFYTDNPTCDDGIKNCHDGSCELLVDCGGPCVPCSTCDDGVQNQGEFGIDCGGPCPDECVELAPIVNVAGKTRRYLYVLVYTLASLFVLVLIRRIWMMRRALRIDKERNAYKL